MVHLFPIASWLEHLGCRKQLLRFSLSWSKLDTCPPQPPHLQNWYILKRWEKGKFLLTFVLLRTCYSYVFHFCFTLCLEASDLPYVLYTSVAMLNMQSSAGSNPKYQHRAHREKNQRSSVSFSMCSFRTKWVPSGFWTLRYRTINILESFLLTWFVMMTHTEK